MVESSDVFIPNIISYGFYFFKTSSWPGLFTSRAWCSYKASAGEAVVQRSKWAEIGSPLGKQCR